MAQRGGKRPGAGRPKGSVCVASRLEKRSLAEIARVHTPDAITALVRIASKGKSEAARVSAAVALLDRGYGKPVQQVQHGGIDGGPIQYEDVGALDFIAKQLDGMGKRMVPAPETTKH